MNPPTEGTTPVVYDLERRQAPASSETAEGARITYIMSYFAESSPLPSSAVASDGMLGGPTSGLPVELLSKIMLIAVGDFITPLKLLPTLAMLDNAIDKRAPWNFTAVSRHWRDVALSTPALWSNLSILTMGKACRTTDSRNSFISLVSMVLQRAKLSTLSFTLLAFDVKRGVEKLYSDVLDMFIARSEDWKTANIMLTDAIFRGSNLAKLRGRLPNLEHLTMDLPRLSEENHLDMFEICPKLWIVEITWHKLESLHLPWQQLRQGRFNITLGHPLDILRKMPCVDTVELMLNYDLDPEDSSPLTLPALRHLAFTMLSRNFELSLDDLTLPALQSIKLSNTDTASLIQSIPGLICRSGCSITTLIINVGVLDVIPDGEFAILFQFIPTLESLTIAGQVLDDSFFGPLSLPDSETQGPKFLPRLQSVELEMTAVTGSFVDFLWSRIRVLTDVVITRISNITGDAALMRRLRPILEEHKARIAFGFPVEALNKWGLESRSITRV